MSPYQVFRISFCAPYDLCIRIQAMHNSLGLCLTELNQTSVGTSQVLSTVKGTVLSTSMVAQTSTPTSRGTTEVRFFLKNTSVAGLMLVTR